MMCPDDDEVADRFSANRNVLNCYETTEKTVPGALGALNDQFDVVLHCFSLVCLRSFDCVLGESVTNVEFDLL